MSGVRDLVFKVRMKTQIFLLEGWLRPLRPPQMIRLGTFYGGWWIPEVAPERGAAICVGAGTDVSFDVELQRLGYRVHTADPTPSAIEYVQREYPDLSFLPVGLWNEETELEFEQDSTWSESWMAGSVRTSAEVGRGQVARFPVTTVRGLMERTGEDRVAVLKMDIEGAEHDVIAQMLADGVRPECLCIEFDDHRVRKVLASTKALRRAGYQLWHIEDLNYIFVRPQEA